MTKYIPSTAYEPGFPVEWDGLDLNSAENATPRWYGVSHGNGNDGVSRMYADYYVRTRDPYALAELACVAHFNADWRNKASEEVEIDGEADYCISAVISEPLDYEPEQRFLNHYHCDECDEEWEEEWDCTCNDRCPTCGHETEPYESEDVESNPDDSWSANNGAWHITEVFPVEASNTRWDTVGYEKLEDVFTADFIAKYASED